MNDLILTPIPLETLLQSFRSIIKEEIKAEQKEDLQDKLLSPSETCKLFQPNITKVTLATWTDKGLLVKHTIGGRVFYKYSEIMGSLNTLKKYKTKGS